MYKNKFYLIIFSTLFMITPFLSFAEESWNKEFIKEGITVYTRLVEGSPLKEFKGEAVIEASMEVCKNVLVDIENHVKWRPDCIESKLIRKDGNDYITYDETKAPWPVSNRDVVLQNTMSTSRDKIIFTFFALDNTDLVHLKEGVVRMTGLIGSWTLARQNGHTLAIFQAKINPGGSLPAWLANKTSIDQPFKSLQGLKQMVKDQKYQIK
jgi:hypothetical protein